MSVKDSGLESRRKHNLRRLLSPRHVAFVGGQGAAEAIRQCVKSGFSGPIWPVHPRHTELAGKPCFSSLVSLPEAPDATFIAVRREATVEVVRELAAMGAGGCVCYAAGFAEVGGDGTKLQQALVKAAGDIALVGPNCYGVVNYVDGVALWPSGFGGTRVGRGVAVIAQSGNVALNLTMSQRSVPYAYVVSSGNQAQLGIADYVEFFAEDPHVSAIGLYIEGLTDVPAFSRAAALALARRIPIVAMKAGRSKLGAALAVSHTSALSGDDRLWSALFDRLGICRVFSLSQLLETLKLFSVAGLPAGNRLAAFTCSGGDSLMVADLADRLGLSLPEFDPRQVDRLRPLLPEFATISNPLDYNTSLWGNQSALTECFTLALGEGFDAGMLIIDYPVDDPVGKACCDAAVDAVIAAQERTGKMVTVTSTLPELMPESVRQRLIDHGIPPCQGLEEALTAFAVGACQKHRRTEISEGDLESVCLPALRSMRSETRIIDEYECKQRLAAFGIGVPRGCLAAAHEAPGMAAEIGFPVVLKVAQPAIAHKTDAGAVTLNLNSESEVMAAVMEMTASVSRHYPDLKIEKFLVEEQIQGSVAELIVGVRQDEQFGLVLVVGAGGTLAEILDDVATLLLPTDQPSVTRVINGLRVAKLLAGYRNQPAGDIESLINSVLFVACFAEANRERLVELDVNPLLVLPRGQGTVAVDAMIVVADT